MDDKSVQKPMGEGERAEITGRPESDAEKAAQTQAARSDRSTRIPAQRETPAAVVARSMAGVTTKEYGVVRPTLHGKKLFHRGETIDLRPEDAKHLLESKAIGLISNEPVFLIDGAPMLPDPESRRIYPLSGDDSLDLGVGAVLV